ncbi:DEAD/DEAH box helicase, partial [Actinoplanes sp. RD1]|uniref:DEAD/DEAH box helicase n=1 Tax=Actinoplanes sp. RD1 TaxID=3064538 RepID=UPI0035571D1A
MTAQPAAGDSAVTVLHGFLARDGGLALWGEAAPGAGPRSEAEATSSGSSSPAATSSGPSSPAATSSGATLPAATSAGAVRRSAARGSHPFAVAVGRNARPATLVLPSTTAGPLPSPALGLPPRRGEPRWRAWAVPAVEVPFVTDDLADELGMRAAPSFRYLAELCEFAAGLVARGRVLPALRHDGARAYWRPVLTGADAARHADLLDRMPAACRAERARPGDVAGLPAPDALHAALERLVDGLVRTRLAETGTTLAGAPWLAALTTDDGLITPSAPAGGSAAPAGGPHAFPGDAATPSGGPHAFPSGPDTPSGGPHAFPGGPATPAGGPHAFPGGPATPAGGPHAFPGGPATPSGNAGGTSAHPVAAVLDPASSSGDLDAVAAALDEWHSEASSGSSVRVVFRLSRVEETDDDLEEADATTAHLPAGLPPAATGERADGWLLEFLLQPVDEPSLLVPAGEVWRDSVAPLRRWTHRPQERLLAGLGRAARLFPGLDPALSAARPTELLLDTAGAYTFLEHAEILEQAGYGVLLPAWWREPLRLGLALDVRTPEFAAPVLRDQAADLATIVRYQWGLALGGQVLTERELSELAHAKVPLVRLRGRWVFLDAERVRAGLDFLRRGGGSMTAGEALRLVRLLPPEELPLPVAEVHGSGWVADLLSGRLGEHLELLEVPEGFSGVLRAYQRRGFSWLAFLDGLGLGACLADDMGLGKTVQLLALLLHRRTGPTLLICPLSVLGNWQREAERFAPGLRVRVLHGADRPGPGGLAEGADVVLTTYATATRDADELAKITWDRVVLDEAQHVKNSASEAARAVRRFDARTRIALTGTPVENRLAELWSILDFVNPGLLGGPHTFRNRFAVPIERYADEEAASRLRQATRPFLLRRVKSDPAVLDDLPVKRHTRHLCGLTAEQATLYQAVLDDMRGRLTHTNETPRSRPG